MSQLLQEFEEQRELDAIDHMMIDCAYDHFEEDWSDYDRDMDIWDYYDEPDDLSDFEYNDPYDPWYEDDYSYHHRSYRENTSRYQVVDTGTDHVVTEGRSLADILIEIQKLQLS